MEAQTAGVGVEVELWEELEAWAAQTAYWVGVEAPTVGLEFDLEAPAVD